jgi:hypothetical protein
VERLNFTFTNPDVFRKFLECVSKFVDKAHFDVCKDGLHIRSIDPDDFCYVEALLRTSFLQRYRPKTKLSFGVDVSKFSKFLPRLASARAISMTVYDEALELEATRNWPMQFRINFLKDDPYDLPEPKRLKYDAFVEIPSKEFSHLINVASTISNELNFTILGKRFIVSARSGDYSYSGEPSTVSKVVNNGAQNVSTSVIANYIKTLDGLINKCETVRVRIGNDKPLQLEFRYQDKGVFSFTLSHKKRSAKQKKVTSRDGSSLPRLTVSRLPEFLLYLKNCPEGEKMGFLREAGLETSGGDYSRMAQKLGMVQSIRGRIKLSGAGDVFVNLMQNNQEQARGFLHTLALSKIKPYKIMMNCLKRKALAPEELYKEINQKLGKKREYSIDRQDFSTLLGLAIWCEIVDKKLALYYLRKGGQR